MRIRKDGENKMDNKELDLISREEFHEIDINDYCFPYDDIVEEWEISAYEQYEEKEREELEERAWRVYTEERKED